MVSTFSKSRFVVPFALPIYPLILAWVALAASAQEQALNHPRDVAAQEGMDVVVVGVPDEEAIQMDPLQLFDQAGMHNCRGPDQFQTIGQQLFEAYDAEVAFLRRVCK